MLQSVRIIQFISQFTILILILVAVQLHSWTIIEFTNIDTSIAKDNNFITRLVFAPDRYCFRNINGSSTCQPFLHAILDNSRQTDDWSDQGPDPFESPSLTLESDNVINQALSCWCHTRGSLTWYMQGATNLACLVVLETVKYTLALWGLFATVNLVISSTSISFNFKALFSFVSALFGFLAILTWWFYSSTYFDRDYVKELALNWKHGTSYHCILIAFVLASLNARIAFDATSSINTPKYTRRFVRPTPRIYETNEWDPMSYPANYLV
ncbi:hypothetical protein Plhal304r1_c051g0134001 [Plasmopara halstedii]